jgi:hypothetical protein
MAAVYVSNLVINCGADFSQTFTLESISGNTPYNLTNHIVESKLRKHAGSSSFVEFDCTVVSETSGNIRIELTSEQTSSIKPGRYVYDILVTDSISSIKTRVVEGMVLVREGVT